MENATHTLAGLALAEAALRLRRPRLDDPAERALASAAYAVSAVANNLPDIDVVFTSVLGGTLNYLLHHRGHTHTLAAVPILALAALAIPWLIAHRKRAGLSWGNAEWKLLGALALLGPLVHVGLDFLNSYGVHPFWPVNNGWFYGDTIFIVEPLFWLALAPPLFFAVTRRWGRVCLALLPLIGLALVWGSGFVPVRIAVPVTALGVLSFVAARKATPRRRIAQGVGAFFAVLSMFAVARRDARSGAARELESAYPGWTNVDLVMAPAPANPLCWSLIAVQRKGSKHALRRGRIALFPRLLAAPDCPERIGGLHPPVVAARAVSGGQIVWTGEAEQEFDDLAALARGHCEARAFFQFARAPFALMREGLPPYLVDLRFDRTPDKDLAELALESNPMDCQNLPAPWDPPLPGL